MRYYLAPALTLLLLHFCCIAAADHILGGELSYTYLSGNTYRVTLTMYGECSGGSYPHLKNAAPHINVFNNSGKFFTLTLSEEVNNRKEISNVCPAELSNTTCNNPAGTIPGVTRFVYSSQAEMPPAAEWTLLFNGHMDNTGKSQSGLSNFISNIETNSGGFGIHLYLQAELNNERYHNSSPKFTTDPAPFYCINVPEQYNPGAVDPDNDQLKFSMVAPIDINGLETKYFPQYSPTYPFSAHNQQIKLDEHTGQISFTPAKVEVALVVNKVEEFKDGEMVGSSMRAMTFFVRNNCNNEAPYGGIDPATVQGGILHDNIINLCDTSKHIEFSIPVRDKNGDKINVSLTNVPNGANTQIQGNNTPTPTIKFSWDMHSIPPGIYTFFANYNDGACPMPGNQTVAYSIRVAEPFYIFHEVLEATNCKYKQFLQFHIGGGIEPRKLQVTDESGNAIAYYTSTEQTIKDSFEVGIYHAILYSDHLPCSTEYEFEVTDYGTYPEPPEIDDIHLCLKDEKTEISPQPSPGGTIQWYDVNKNLLNEWPEYDTDSVATYKWLINQKVKVCPSVFDTFEVAIHDYPDIEIENKGGHACVGDGIYLVATGGVRYEWQPESEIVYYDDKPFTYVYNPTEYIVTGYSEYDCASKDTLVFDDIEDCCLFTYPTAFTPDQNGLNDGWRPITYGNVDFYLLSIYNRWGERIYTSSDPKARWDGTWHGKKCDIGTYHYLLKARCVTGQEEKGRGSFVLLR